MTSLDVAGLLRAQHICAEDSDFVTSLVQQCPSLRSRPLIIYGAGSAGGEMRAALALHGLSAVAFCDGNAQLWGTQKDGLTISSLADLRALYPDACYVLGTNRHKQEIKASLRAQGIEQICAIDDDEAMYYYLNFTKWHCPLENLLRDRASLQAAFDLLADQKSRDLFVQRLVVLTSFADYRLYEKLIALCDAPPNWRGSGFRFAQNFESEMYFANDLIALEEAEILLDCGAFTGDSAECFLREMQTRNLNAQHIYCFEPDGANFAKLESFIAGRGTLSAHKIGLWNEPGQLNFSSSDMMFSSEAGIVQPSGEGANDGLVIVKADGDSVIQVDKIDAVLQGGRASLIKMDIEGSEAQALEGARETLRQWKPKLVISAYHKRSDIYELALLMRRLNPEYRIYLRQFSFSLSELVLIAL